MLNIQTENFSHFNREKLNLIDSLISSSKKNDHNIPVIYPMFMSEAVDDFYFELNKNYTDTFKHNYQLLLSLL